MIASIWNHRLIRAVENSRLVHNVLVAFNSNIDAKEISNKLYEFSNENKQNI